MKLDQNLIRERAITLENELNRWDYLNDEGVKYVRQVFGASIEEAKQGLIKEPKDFGSYLRLLVEICFVPEQHYQHFMSTVFAFERAVQGVKDFSEQINLPVAKKYADLVYSMKDHPSFSEFLKNKEFVEYLALLRTGKIKIAENMYQKFDRECRGFNFYAYEALGDALAKLIALVEGDQNIE